jgi:hypothetical protein
MKNSYKCESNKLPAAAWLRQTASQTREIAVSLALSTTTLRRHRYKLHVPPEAG